MKLRKLPDYIKTYLWDTDGDSSGQTKYLSTIGSRILDQGDQKAVKWLTDHYAKEDIRDILRTSRNLSLKSASFWALLYDVPQEEVRCFQEPYRTTKRKLWPY